MKQPKTLKLTIKRTISWIVGIPAVLIAVGEVNDLRFWWVPFAAMVTAFAIMKWNEV